MGKGKTMKSLCIAGFGAVCENAHIPVIKKLNERFLIKGVLDTDEKRRKKAAELLKANTYSDIDEMLSKESPDSMVITSPPSSHKEIIIKALDKGIDVLCEKPLCTNLRDFKEIEREVSKSGKVVYTIHNWVYSPHILKINDFIKEIGEIRRINWETLRKKPSVSASSNWRIDPHIAGGGIIFDHGWHVIYIIKSMINNDFDDVDAFFVLNENNIDEIADFRIEYGSVIADIHLSWRSAIRKNIMTAYGDRGTLLFDDDRIILNLENGEKKEHFFDEKLSQSSAHPLWTEKVYIDFYDSLKNREKFELNFNQSLECISIIERAYESFKQRKTKDIYN